MPDGISATLDVPEQFRPHVIDGAGLLNVMEVEYRVLILDRQMRAPRWFCGLCPTSDWLYISDEVPAEYRLPMLQHEVYEHRHFGQEEYPCVAALQRELKELSGLDVQAYLDFRLETLRELSRHVHRRELSEFYRPPYRADVSLAYTLLQTRLQR